MPHVNAQRRKPKLLPGDMAFVAESGTANWLNFSKKYVMGSGMRKVAVGARVMVVALRPWVNDRYLYGILYESQVVFVHDCNIRGVS